MRGEHLRLASNSAACPTILRHSIFSIFFCEHLRSILKKVDAQARFGISLMCSPAEIFVLVHGQQRFSDGPTCRLRLLPPAAPVVQGYSSEVNIVRTDPLSCKHLRSISKKKRKSLSRLVFRVRRQGFLYRPRPPVAAVVQGFSSEFHVLEQSVRILCLANEVGLQLSIVCFQPSATCEVS